MAKTFTARGSDGLVAIHEPNADLNNPVGNLHNIYFHSGLQYLSFAYSRDVSINLNHSGSAFVRPVYTLFAHGMGRPVMCMAVRDNGDVMAGSMILRSSNGNASFATVSSDNTYIYLRAILRSFGSMNLNLKIYVFDNLLF